MFYEIQGEVFRCVLDLEEGCWIVSYDSPVSPKFVVKDNQKNLKQIKAPERFLKESGLEQTEGELERLRLIDILVTQERCIYDSVFRNSLAKEIAEEHQTTVRRVLHLYYKKLAGRKLIEKRESKKKQETEDGKIFKWAIERYYYSAKKYSLQSVYDLMLLAKYVDEDGKLVQDYPSFYRFRHFFYKNEYDKNPRNKISRNGLGEYLRNDRVLSGKANCWKESIGTYQMDATQADIYLVSSVDRKTIVGRPYIYLAVDTATQMIAGIHIGFKLGHQAVVSCLVNAASDKSDFCGKYGINIVDSDWSCCGLPGEVVTDKGAEFFGNRMMELAKLYQMDIQTLAPFRPDQKSLVEKTFDLIQGRYKTQLRGKGIVEPDAQERWAIDYRQQAVLTLEDYTKIVIQCVLHLNKNRILDDGKTAVMRWRELQEQGKSILRSTDDQQLYLISLERKQVHITRKGITINGMRYICKDPKVVQRFLRKRMVTIAFDEECIDRIYVVEDGEFIAFQLLDNNFTGVSKLELQVVQNERKEQRKALEHQELEGRLNVIREIEAVVKDSERRK